MQAVARRKCASAPFTSLENQAVAPGASLLEDVWGCATPSFHHPKVPSVTQLKKQSVEQLSDDSLQNEVHISCMPLLSEHYANKGAKYLSRLVIRKMYQ